MEETKVVGPLIFGLFCLCFNIILINFFITVILEGFTAVRQDEQKQTNDYEIVNFMMRRLKMVMGIGAPRQKPRKNLMAITNERHKFVYVESMLA